MAPVTSIIITRQMINEKVVLAIIMTASIGAVAGYLGTLMLSKRMSLVGGPLGHLTLPGITLALLYGFDVSLGAFAAQFSGLFLSGYLRKEPNYR